MYVYSGATHFEARTIAAALSVQRLTRRIVGIKMAATFILNLQLNRVAIRMQWMHKKFQVSTSVIVEMAGVAWDVRREALFTSPGLLQQQPEPLIP